MSNETVFRLVHRRAKPGCAAAYEALVAAMFEDARRFPGFLSAILVPPENPAGEYQITQRFTSEADLERWQRSPERLAWLEKLAAVAEGEPEYRYLTGLDAWFAPAVGPVAALPPRWRMTLVSWLGIFPTVALLQWIVGPWLQPLPTLLGTAIFTILVAILMSYVVMPRLTRWMGWWLRR